MSRQLGWGLIGCGDIARKRVAPALRDLSDCTFIGVSRARCELAEEFAREFGARKWYRDWYELIADPEIDAVYVASPVCLHSEQTIAAARNGKHVLCEKPMAMTVAECDEMIAVCRRSGVRLGIAYYRHFYPVIDRIRDLIQSGGIGRPVLAQINSFEWFNPESAHPRRWLIEKEKSGGGPMFDFGCHRIEVLLNVLGPISRTGSTLGTVAFERGVEDTAVALFEFESGARGVLTVTHAAFESADTLDIFGTLGSLHVPVLNSGTLRILTADGERIENHPPDRNIHLPLIDDFTRSILDDREPRVGAGIGRSVALIEEEIYRQAVV